MTQSKKTVLYLCLISTLAVIASLIITPWLNFYVSLAIYVMAPIYIILMLLAIRYVRKELIYHSPKLGRVTGRTVFIFELVLPIVFLFVLVEFEVVLTSRDITALILWGFTNVINLIAIIVYKRPKEKQQKTVF